MKKYLVIGNPIEHSLSPILHNHWIKKNEINAVYEKKKLEEHELDNLILNIKNKKIDGVNITVPFKKKIIPYLDKLSDEALKTQSVNTVYLNEGKIIGHNTDIIGFEIGLKKTNYNVEDKKILILGAGGVVSSIIFAVKKMKASEIMISNRTHSKAESLKKIYSDLKIVKWGEVPDFDVVINATSVGLNVEDIIDLDFSKIGKNKLFFDVIYNPKETNFLNMGKKLGNITENGKFMFIYQASAAFEIWHGVRPKINKDVIKLLDL